MSDGAMSIMLLTENEQVFAKTATHPFGSYGSKLSMNRFGNNMKSSRPMLACRRFKFMWMDALCICTANTTRSKRPIVSSNSFKTKSNHVITCSFTVSGLDIMLKKVLSMFPDKAFTIYEPNPWIFFSLSIIQTIDRMADSAASLSLCGNGRGFAQTVFGRVCERAGGECGAHCVAEL